MKKKVFYSWQSDLPNKSNRGFIGSALEKAIDLLVADDEFTMTPFLDRDTLDELGSPDIVQTIFKKIDDCDVFICDISFINGSEGDNKRLVPNPNVTLELGYAAGKLGWEKIVLVMNTHFGGVENLPFDLRGRRVLTYHLDPENESKADERKKVSASLTTSIKKILNHFNGQNETLVEIVAPPEPLPSGRESTILEKLELLRGIPYQSDRSKALSKASNSLVEKNDLDNAFLFASEIPYSSEKSKALCNIATVAIQQNKLSLAGKVANEIPYSSDKNRILKQITLEIEL